MRNPRLLEVEWIDSFTQGRWDEATDYAKAGDSDLTCRSIGYALVNNKDRVVLVQSKSHGGQKVSDSITIPRACIKRVRRLKGGL